MQQIIRHANFIESARQVGWMNPDAELDVEQVTSWKAPFSPPIWLGSVNSSDLMPSLQHRAYELFAQSHGIETAERLNPRFESRYENGVDKAEAAYIISRVETGQSSIACANLLQPLIPVLKEYAQLWQKAYAPGSLTGTLLRQSKTPSPTPPFTAAEVPRELLTRPMTKAEAVELHCGEKRKNPTDYFKKLIDSGAVTAPIKVGGKWQFYARDFPVALRDKISLAGSLPDLAEPSLT